MGIKRSKKSAPTYRDFVSGEIKKSG